VKDEQVKPTEQPEKAEPTNPIVTEDSSSNNITPADSAEKPEQVFNDASAEPVIYDDPDHIYEMDEVIEEDEYSPEERKEWEARYADAMKEFGIGELVNGKIVSISDKDVTVDIGFKSEGLILLEEFDEPENMKVGDEVEVCIERIENRAGTLVLSKRKAEFIRTWEKISELYNSGEMIEAQIARRIKGGMVVDLYGVEAFLPGSQIDIHPVRDFDALVGVAMDFRVIKINNARKNVVLSHKVLIEESLREIREKVLAALEVGQVVEGVVKNITDFGVFVDLGGVDGLLHITDLSWGRVSHPSEVVALDEKIKIKVLQYDKERQRISLGLKQLNEPDWDDIEAKYPKNSKTTGKVVAIVKYGAFVELEPGVEGLVHISEMSWVQHIKHPSQMATVGQEIEVVILSFERESRKISLGMKQIEEDPWERLESIYVVGTRHKGSVRDLVPFGAFIELEPGIDGLIHISDLSWTRKVRHPGEIIKKGQEIEIVILKFDRNERRIALGYKQLEDDPWDSFEKEYQIRARTEGSVIRVLEKGVVVMLPMGVEGFIPNSQLGRSLAGENKRNIKEGDNVELEVIDFDKQNHRIVLSHSIIERKKAKTSTYRTAQDSGASNKATIGDLIEAPKRKENGKPAPKTKVVDIVKVVEVVEKPAEAVKEEQSPETLFDEPVAESAVKPAEEKEKSPADPKEEEDKKKVAPKKKAKAKEETEEKPKAKTKKAAKKEAAEEEKTKAEDKPEPKSEKEKKDKPVKKTKKAASNKEEKPKKETAAEKKKPEAEDKPEKATKSKSKSTKKAKKDDETKEEEKK